jgi:hypothetical protein
MVERFNTLADRDNLDFEAWFNDRLDHDRSWTVYESSWRFRYRYLPSTNILRHKSHWLTPILGRRPDMLVSLHAQPSFLVGWTIAKLSGSKTAFWCQFTFDRWVKRRAWKESLKRIVFPRVDAILGSGEDSQAFAMRYIVPPDDNTIMAERMVQFVNSPELREQMGKISASKIAGYTPEKFAAGFEEIVLSLL